LVRIVILVALAAGGTAWDHDPSQSEDVNITRGFHQPALARSPIARLVEVPAGLFARLTESFSSDPATCKLAARIHGRSAHSTADPDGR
jgi:hypothetical protein